MDQEAFETFYSQTNTSLFGYVMRLCENASISEDIVQESFLRFLEKPPRQHHFQAQKAYLYTIAARLLADYFRTENKNRKIVSGSYVKGSENVTVDLIAETDPLIQETLDELGHHDKSLLWLAYVEGFEHKEIGKLLKLKPSSIKVLLFRARQRFKELIAKKNK